MVWWKSLRLSLRDSALLRDGFFEGFDEPDEERVLGRRNTVFFSESTDSAAKHINLGLLTRLDVLQHGGFEGGRHIADEIFAPREQAIHMLDADLFSD